MLGRTEKERLAELLHAGPVTNAATGERSLSQLADDRDVRTVLLEEGIALPYKPGKAARQAGQGHKR